MKCIIFNSNAGTGTGEEITEFIKDKKVLMVAQSESICDAGFSFTLSVFYEDLEAPDAE